MTLRDKCVRDWRPQYAKQLPVPMKCKQVYTIDNDTGTHKYLSFTSIGSEGNVLANGATLYFYLDHNTVYPISDSSRKSLPMRLRAYATQLRNRNLTIKRRALG